VKDKTTALLWGVYLALLAVLLPHTAWLFGAFEPVGPMGTGAAWAGALAFESAIAVLTHKLAQRIGKTPKRATRWQAFLFRYANAYAAGLVIAVAVSALANLAHAVEFGSELAIFARWGITPVVYQLAFGGVLPFVSLLFANVLSNEVEEDASEDPELVKVREANAELRRQLHSEEKRAKAAETELVMEQRKFASAAEKFAGLFVQEKRARIIAIRQAWPELQASAVAMLAESSPSYVSEVLAAEFEAAANRKVEEVKR